MKFANPAALSVSNGQSSHGNVRKTCARAMQGTLALSSPTAHRQRHCESGSQELKILRRLAPIASDRARLLAPAIAGLLKSCKTSPTHAQSCHAVTV